MDEIILVDEQDNQIGGGEKMEVHRSGKMHRAFSIFVFNNLGELMMQKRAKSKYHSGGLWTNTCCSHPRAGEKTDDAVHRRLMEEMGFDCELKELFSFTYRVDFDNELIENEYDHVYVGRYDGEPSVNPEEADGWQWVHPEKIKEDIKTNPGLYTFWFKIAFEKLSEASDNKFLTI